MKEIIKYEELFQAYLDCIKHKRNTYNALEFEINSHELLYKLWIELNDMTYTIGKSITFCVFQPCHREIFAADFRDRIVHHLLINKTMHLFESEFIEDSYSCREGKGVQYGVRRCNEHIKRVTNNYTEDCYIIKGDFKSFFMNIDKQILIQKVYDLIDKKCEESQEIKDWLKWCYNLVISNAPQFNCIRKQHISAWDGLPVDKSLFSKDVNTGLPIGNLTSQILANFYLADFDKYISNYPSVEAYGRYVDDFYILTKDKSIIIKLLNDIKEFLRAIKVKLHPKKLYIQHYNKGLKFIGCVIKPGRIYISNRTKHKLIMVSHYIDKIIKYKHSAGDLKYYESCINSYLGFMIHYNTYNIRYKILYHLDNLNDYFYSDTKKSKILLFKDFLKFAPKKHRYWKLIFYMKQYIA